MAILNNIFVCIYKTFLCVHLLKVKRPKVCDTKKNILVKIAYLEGVSRFIFRLEPILLKINNFSSLRHKYLFCKLTKMRIFTSKKIVFSVCL